MATNVNTRLETFCDGVFAIAITLLILEIKVPPLESIHSSEDLVHDLLHHWTSWFAFLLSFGTILIAWVNHHVLFKYLDKSSTLFVFANGFLLLTIAVLPFPTALMAEYINTPYAKTAIVVYCISSLLFSTAWLLLFQSAVAPKSLAKSATAHQKLLTGRKQTAYGLMIYALICALAFWMPFVAVGFITLSWFAWIVIGILFGDQTEAAE